MKTQFQKILRSMLILGMAIMGLVSCNTSQQQNNPTFPDTTPDTNGIPLITTRFSENGDGTVTDHETGLIWLWVGVEPTSFPGTHPFNISTAQDNRTIHLCLSLFICGSIVDRLKPRLR